MSLREYVAIVQALTCVILGVFFWHPGTYRLAIAQFLYGVTTALIFIR